MIVCCHNHRCTAWSANADKQCGRTNRALSGWIANTACASGKRNRYQCSCNKVYKCEDYSLQILIYYKGIKLEMLSDWPSDETLKLWENYKTAYYRAYEPSEALIDVEIPHTRVGENSDIRESQLVHKMNGQEQDQFWGAVSQILQGCLEKMPQV